MNNKPLRTVEEVADSMTNDTQMQGDCSTRRHSFVNLLTQDRDQAYTSLIEGIEGMREMTPDDPRGDEYDIEIRVNKKIDDIIRRVVKPLYNKE